MTYRDPEWMKTFQTEHITCPYCGYVDHDSWEVRPGDLEFDEEEYECVECEKVYSLSRNAKITYTSRKPQEDEVQP